MGSPSGNPPRIRIVDGTIVKAPGKTGSQWRILYTIRLPELECDFFEVTAAEGACNGESLTRIPAQRGELILGDAIYGGLPGVLAMKQKGADVLIRVNRPHSRRMAQASGDSICYGASRNLLPSARYASGKCGCAAAATRKWRDACASFEKAKRPSTAVAPQEFAHYVMVFITYEQGTAAQV